MKKADKYPIILLCIYIPIWIILAINPLHAYEWILENILTIIFVPLLIITYKKFRFSNISYTCIFLFMVMHAFGSHYTYSEVPLGFLLQNIFDFSRNHFDRIAHFAFGLLFAYPMRELFIRLALIKKSWSYYLPVMLSLALGALYEILEWIVVISAPLVSIDTSAGYLGTQGDVWDAQKDILLAGLGAAAAMTIAYVRNRFFKKK